MSRTPARFEDTVAGPSGMTLLQLDLPGGDAERCELAGAARDIEVRTHLDAAEAALLEPALAAYALGLDFEPGELPDGRVAWTAENNLLALTFCGDGGPRAIRVNLTPDTTERLALHLAAFRA